MMSRCVYSFNLAIAILAIRGCALPLRDDSAEVPSVEQTYDYQDEKWLGLYTGPWVADTLSCFDRVPAVIEHNQRRDIERFVDFSERTPAEGILEEQIPSDSPSPYVEYTIGYARDFRPENMETRSLTNPYHKYFLNSSSCAETKDDNEYPMNKEAVWQIPIPEGYAAMVEFTSFDLEPPQDGSCINDFVSVYVDNETPVKYCSTLDPMKIPMAVGSKQLTIKFKSDEANNSGGFSGEVVMFRIDSYAQMQGWPPQMQRPSAALPPMLGGPPQLQRPSAAVTRMKRPQRDVLHTQALETTNVAEVKRSDEHQIVNEQAIACLNDIAKYGASAAAMYMESAPNEECKKMAEVFFEG